jgi:hypothetical protein
MERQNDAGVVQGVHRQSMVTSNSVSIVSQMGSRGLYFDRIMDFTTASSTDLLPEDFRRTLVTIPFGRMEYEKRG